MRPSSSCVGNVASGSGAAADLPLLLGPRAPVSILRRWAAALADASAALRRAHAGYRRWRRAQTIHAELSTLDDATLRDLGIHRDEIDSVAAEMTLAADRTRVRVLISI